MSVKALENKMALPTKDWGINDQSDLKTGGEFRHRSEPES